MRMKMPKLGMLILAGCVALTTFAAPAVARKDKPAVDPVCDPLTQSIRRNTSAAGLLIGGFDGDGDAATDKAEMKAGTERMFSAADSDRNGELSLIELSEWAAVWLGGQSAVPGRFDFDRDQDDRISRTEFVAELERRFAGFDADKDGRVDRRELLTAGVPKNCVDGRLVPPEQARR